MPIGVGGVSFEGPYSRHEILCRRPGVFVVLDGRSLPPIHAEKTDDVRQAVEGHARWSRWEEECESLTFAVLYTAVDRNQRRVEQAVRDEFGLYEEDVEAGAAAGEEREPATNGRPAENGRPAAENGRASENGRPGASSDRSDRSFRFHVPADPTVHRRVRVS